MQSIGVIRCEKRAKDILTNARYVRQSSTEVFAFINLREIVLPATAKVTRKVCRPKMAYIAVL